MDPDFYDLLDYDEEELNFDLEKISAISNDKEIQMASSAMSATTPEVEFYFSSKQSMKCPVEGCPVESFSSKSKFDRHWMERHLQKITKYLCSMNNCPASILRRYDMKKHLCNIHKITEPERLEMWTNFCKTTEFDNPNFIDPSPLSYRFRSISSSSVIPSVKSKVAIAPSTSATTVIPHTSVASSVPSTSMTSAVCSVPSTSVTSAVSVPVVPVRATPLPDVSTVIATAHSEEGLLSKDTDFAVVVPHTVPAGLSASSGQKISLQDYLLRSSNQPLDVRQVSNFSSSFGIRATSDGATQTLCLDYPPFILPPIPESKDELERYISWLANSMDLFARQRETAKQRLATIHNQNKVNQSEVRALQAENRRLQKELAEAKAREKYFLSEL